MFFGLLIWASYQPAAIGLSLMIMVGIGMAFPYFVLSAFPELARRMPRTGPWAELVKQMMGFLLILAALTTLGIFIAWKMWPNQNGGGAIANVQTNAETKIGND